MKSKKVDEFEGIKMQIERFLHILGIILLILFLSNTDVINSWFRSFFEN